MAPTLDVPVLFTIQPSCWFKGVNPIMLAKGLLMMDARQTVKRNLHAFKLQNMTKCRISKPMNYYELMMI